MTNPIPVVVTNSTVSRRNTVKRLLAGAREIYPNITAVRFLLYLRQIYTNPTTALSYIGTTAFLFPRVKLDPEWKDQMAHATKLANQYAPFADQARVLTFEIMQEMLKSWTNMAAPEITVLFTWTTCSRYGDLKHMLWINDAERDIPQHSLTIGLVDMRGSKGDPKGTRGDQKAIILPSRFADIIKSQCVRDTKRVISAYRFKKVLVTTDPELSLHSCRRGCSQTLARYGYSKQHIQDLSLHQQGKRRETRSQDVYQNGLYLTDTRDLNQIRLQLVLLCQLGLISPSTMQYVSQVWLKQAHSLLPVMRLPMETPHEQLPLEL